MIKPFNLNSAVEEMRILAARVEKLRADYTRWNGGDCDELAEIAADDFNEHVGDA